MKNKLKVKKGLYPQWIEESSQIEQFYQFSLDSTSIIEKFEQLKKEITW